MRFLVSSWFIRPGISGGWVTVADLLQPAHFMAFLGASVPAGMISCEGVPISALSRLARMRNGWPVLNRVRETLQQRALSRETAAAFRRYRADIVLCTDEWAAAGARDAGLPFAIRFHSHPGLLSGDAYGKLLEASLFTTGTQPDFPGAAYLPHSIDLDRFVYSEPEKAESAVMTASLVKAERPDIFVRGTAMSGLRGTITGDGPMLEEIRRLCGETCGRVRLVPPVDRSTLPSLLSEHQIGVACLEKGWHTSFQMKVTEYQAAGLFPVVMPWSGLALTEPGLTRTFTDEAGLASVLDGIRRDWASTLDVRRRNRDFAHARYHVKDARRRFEEILAGLPPPLRPSC